jgi:predicted AAA+ superfamily ATPase
MYARLLKTPSRSIFLFGPRGTGKSTWIRDRFQETRTYDLLDTGEALRLTREPGALYREVSGLAPESWVVIDEVQKVPALLDEVHRLMENHRLRFVLSGSSARKIRRGGSNLLAGRAITNSMFPLVSAERAFDVDVEAALRFGSLPLAVTSADPAEYLRSYAETYLDQEIRAEALTRNLGSFTRFLEVAARQNAQLTNTSAVARDAGVSRSTAQNHFEILVDTLIGFWLPAWKLKSATKQVQSSKFFLFDPGVARALTGRQAYSPTPEERGPLLETLVLHEVRAYLGYTGRSYPLFFWRTYDGAEVDLLFETTDGFVAVEIKSSARWEKRFHRGLRRLRSDLGADRTTCFGLYLGARSALWDDVRVMPVLDFLKMLWNGEIVR